MEDGELGNFATVRWGEGKLHKGKLNKAKGAFKQFKGIGRQGCDAEIKHIFGGILEIFPTPKPEL